MFVLYLRSYSGCHSGSIVYRVTTISELTVSALIGIKYLTLCGMCSLIIQCVKRSCTSFTVLLKIAKEAVFRYKKMQRRAYRKILGLNDHAFPFEMFAALLDIACCSDHDKFLYCRKWIEYIVRSRYVNFTESYLFCGWSKVRLKSGEQSNSWNGRRKHEYNDKGRIILLDKTLLRVKSGFINISNQWKWYNRLL